METVLWLEKQYGCPASPESGSKGWRVLRNQSGVLLRCYTPAGRYVSPGSPAERKLPRHLREELAAVRAAREARERAREEARRYAGLPYAVRRDTAAWDKYTTQLQ